MRRNNVLVVGFADRPHAARYVAKRLDCPSVFATVSTYGAGEMCVRCSVAPAERIIVVSDVSEPPESLFRLLALVQGLRDQGARSLELLSPWIAYGRQDRIGEDGALAIGLAVGQSLSQAFDCVVTLDAHSHAFTEGFDGSVENVFPDYSSFAGAYDLVAAPDRGATERARRVAQALHLPFVILDKVREKKKISAKLSSEFRPLVLPQSHVLLVDDIGDSGATLVAAAVALYEAGAGSVDAFVSHAIDLSSLRKRATKHLTSVATAYDHASGRCSPAALDRLIEAL